MEKSLRIEHDSLGEVRVPVDALYGPQTQRALENFLISPLRFPRPFLRALGLIKGAAASVNLDLGLLEPAMASAIKESAQEVVEGHHDDQFPLDIFQTGSGTSTNMNANEVIARLATQRCGKAIHPNDHVNLCQSSNDVIPSTIHISAYQEIHDRLVPCLTRLHLALETKAASLDHVVTTGRTHLMDAVPIRLSQELSGWAFQLSQDMERLAGSLPRLGELALGGTAVGTSLNAHPEFGLRIASLLAKQTGLPLTSSPNYFARISSQDTAVEISGHMKTLAVSLMKISNDLRWMNSGPNTGLGEITLPALQPGSSIMPGKVNPVILEAATMVCAQVIGNDVTITVAGQSGNFQLNAMLPVVAYNLLQSIELLANATRLLAGTTVPEFRVNEARLSALLNRNPVLVTALNSVIGYQNAAEIAKRAFAEQRTLKDVAAEMTTLSSEELDDLLDPKRMTEGGFPR